MNNNFGVNRVKSVIERILGLLNLYKKIRRGGVLFYFCGVYLGGIGEKLHLKRLKKDLG